jgi:hypothetical protein
VIANPALSRSADFDFRALYAALDEQRRARQLTWTALTAEVNRHRTDGRPISPSTIKSLETKPDGEGDGIIQMLIWLRRTPESFVHGAVDPHSPCFTQPDLSPGKILRWDTRALFAALDEYRRAQSLTWAELARAIPGFTPAMLQNLDKGGRIGLRGVMRLARFLGQPAASFTRAAEW